MHFGSKVAYWLLVWRWLQLGLGDVQAGMAQAGDLVSFAGSFTIPFGSGIFSFRSDYYALMLFTVLGSLSGLSHLGLTF